MIAKQIQVQNPHGLHMRVAGELIRLARASGSRIVLERQDNRKTAEAESMLGLLLLEATPGTDLVVKVEGPEESRTVIRIEELFEGGAGI